jgi:hypothetical protein
MFDPLDAAVAHHDHVESHAAPAQSRITLQEEAGGRGYAPLFAAPDAGGGTAKLFTAARADFRDDQQVVQARDHVEFAHPPQKIARDDGETLRLEKCGGAVFRQRASLTAVHAIAPEFPGKDGRGAPVLDVRA